jgi:hypothetical protein
MKKKSKKNAVKCDLEKDLWVNPHSNIRGPEGNWAWDKERNISPDRGSRFLALADIALGISKAAKNRSAPLSHHSQTYKNE